MTLSILMYAMMLCSLAALIVVLVTDGVGGRVKRLRPMGVAASVSSCAPGRTRHGSMGSPGIGHASRGHGAAGRRRR